MTNNVWVNDVLSGLCPAFTIGMLVAGFMIGYRGTKK